jgi:hypothetical protein
VDSKRSRAPALGPAAVKTAFTQARCRGGTALDVEAERGSARLSGAFPGHLRYPPYEVVDRLEVGGFDLANGLFDWLQLQFSEVGLVGLWVGEGGFHLKSIPKASFRSSRRRGSGFGIYAATPPIWKRCP